MKQIGIIQLPGSNCERETAMAVKRVGMQPRPLLWFEQPNWHDLDGFVIIGGFAYEDRVRAGLIASQLPLIQALKSQASQGKPILGICNGAQILLESGLVPGLVNEQIGAALTVNKRMINDQVVGTGYYNAWCYIQPREAQPESVFGQGFDSPICAPIAHAEGRFVMPNATLQALQHAGATLWQYCDEHGNIDAHFPINPNGSMQNLAAISNPAGNVLAMMPHPERTHNGDVIFKSMRAYLEKSQPVTSKPLQLPPPATHLDHYSMQQPGIQLLTKMAIVDNEAVTLNMLLSQLNIAVQCHKYVHWEIQGDFDDKPALQQQLIDSYELLNPSKENVLAKIPPHPAILVREHTDIIGQQKTKVLRDHMHFKSIRQIHRSMIWQADTNHDGAPLLQAVKHHLFHNPYAHEIYHYDHKTSI